MAVVGSARVLVTPDFSSFGGLLKTGILAGLASLGPSLAPAIGILGAIPGAALAGGSALGVLKLGFSGVGDALKEAGKAQAGAGASAAKSAADQISSANAIASANDAVADSVRALANLQRDSAQQAISDAESVQKAQLDLTNAQKGLNTARQQALIDLRNLNNEQDKNELSVRDATLALQQAQIDYNKTILNPNTTALGRAQAQLSVDEATQRLKDAQTAQADGTAALSAAQAKGVEGSDAVVAAKQKETDATQSLTDAQAKQTGDQLDNADALVKANEDVASALRSQQLAYAQAASAAQSSGGAAALAMGKLSTIQKQLVNEILNLKPALNDAKTAIQNAFLPGVISGIKSAATDIGIFKDGLVGSATVGGKFFQDLGTLISSPSFKQDLPGLFANTNGFLSSLSGVALSMTTIFKNIAVAAEPLLTFVGSGLDTFFKNLATESGTLEGQNKLKKFFQETIDVIHNLGQIAKNTFGIIKDLVAPFFDLSTSELGGLSDTLAKIKTSLDGIDPNKIKNIGLATVGGAAVAKVAPTVLSGASAALPLLFSPEGAVLAGIGAVGVALYKLDPQFKAFVNNAVADVKAGNWSKLASDITTPFVDGFKKAFGSNDAQSALGQTKTFKDGTKNNLSSLYSDIGARTSDLAKNFVKTWGEAFGPNGSGTKFVAEFKKDIGPIFQDIIKIVDEFVTLFDVIWDKFGKIIVDYVLNSLTSTMKIIRGALDVITGVISLFVDLITGKWGKLWDDLKQIVKGFGEILVGLIDGIKNILVTGFNILVTAAKAVWDKFWSELSSPISTAFDAVVTFLTKTAPTKVADALVAVGTAITTFFSNLGTTFENIGKDIVDAIIRGIKDEAGSLGDALKNAVVSPLKALGTAGDTALKFLHIKGAAKGGIVEPTRGGQLVNVGEGGEREYIVPQSKLAAFVSALTQKDNTNLPKVPTAATAPVKGGLSVHVENQNFYAATDSELFAKQLGLAYALGGNG